MPNFDSNYGEKTDCNRCSFTVGSSELNPTDAQGYRDPVVYEWLGAAIAYHNRNVDDGTLDDEMPEEDYVVAP